ncbi:hypothetical protein VF21_01961 [Pseudogymnoascus sp. 05NY08]|nr:hypothetical protein VF21_01961 [Pseudogymnoascus sp. 05NY08]
MNIGYHKKLVGLVNDDRYGRGVEHIGRRRKTIVELANRAQSMRCLEEAKEDIHKLEKENEKFEDEATEWEDRADELETAIDKIIADRGLHEGAKEDAIAKYQVADKVRPGLELEFMREELAKAIERQEAGRAEGVMKTLKDLFKTAREHQDTDLSSVVRALSDNLSSTRKAIGNDTESAVKSATTTLSDNFLKAVKPHTKEIITRLITDEESIELREKLKTANADITQLEKQLLDARIARTGLGKDITRLQNQLIQANDEHAQKENAMKDELERRMQEVRSKKEEDIVAAGLKFADMLKDATTAARKESDEKGQSSLRDAESRYVEKLEEARAALTKEHSEAIEIVKSEFSIKAKDGRQEQTASLARVKADYDMRMKDAEAKHAAALAEAKTGHIVKEKDSERKHAIALQRARGDFSLQAKEVDMKHIATVEDAERDYARALEAAKADHSDTLKKAEGHYTAALLEVDSNHAAALSEVEVKLTGATRRVLELEAAIKKQEDELARANTTAARAVQLGENAANHEKEITKLREELTVANATATRVPKLETAAMEQNKLEVAVAEQGMVATTLQAKLSEATQSLGENERIAIRIQELETDVIGYTTRIEEVQSTSAALGKELEQKDAELAQEHTKLVEHEVVTAALSKQAVELNDQVSQYKAEKKRFKVDIDAVKRDRQDAEKQVNRLKNELKVAREKNVACDTTCQTITTERDELQQRAKTLEGDLLTAVAANDDLRREVDEIDEERKDLDTHIMGMAGKADFEEIETERDELRTKLESLQDSVEESQRRTSELERQVEAHENVRLNLATANRRVAELEKGYSAKASTMSSLSFEGADRSSPAAKFPQHGHLSHRDRSSTPSSRGYEAQSSTGSKAMPDAPDDQSSAGSNVTPEDRGRSLYDSSMEIQGKEKVLTEYRSPQERARVQAFGFSRATLSKSRLPPWRVAALKLRAPATKPLNPNAAPWAPMPPAAPYGFPMMPAPWLPPAAWGVVPPWAMPMLTAPTVPAPVAVGTQESSSVTIPPPAARQASTTAPTSVDSLRQITSAESVTQPTQRMEVAPVIPPRQSSVTAPTSIDSFGQLGRESVALTDVPMRQVSAPVPSQIFGQPSRLSASMLQPSATPFGGLNPSARVFSFPPEIPARQASLAAPTPSEGLNPSAQIFSFPPEIPARQSSAAPTPSEGLNTSVQVFRSSSEFPARQASAAPAPSEALDPSASFSADFTARQPSVTTSSDGLHHPSPTRQSPTAPLAQARTYAASAGAFVVPPRASSLQIDRTEASRGTTESLARTRQLWGEATARNPTADSSSTTQSTSFDNSRGAAGASTASSYRMSVSDLTTPTHSRASGSNASVRGQATPSNIPTTAYRQASAPVATPSVGWQTSTTPYGQMGGSGYETSASSLSVHGQMSRPAMSASAATPSVEYQTNPTPAHSFQDIPANPIEFISTGQLRNGQVALSVHAETLEMVRVKIRQWKMERGLDPDALGNLWALPNSRRVMCVYLKLHIAANEMLNFPQDKNPATKSVLHRDAQSVYVDEEGLGDKSVAAPTE